MFLSGKSSVINGIVAKLHFLSKFDKARGTGGSVELLSLSPVAPSACRLYYSFACLPAVFYAREQGNNKTGCATGDKDHQLFNDAGAL